MNPNIEAQIRALVVELSGDVAIDANTSFADDLGFDSLDRVDLTLAIEDTFHIELPDDVDEIQTFGQAVQFVENALSNASV
jgi:acyl carrier protein